jgi:rhodanese-related sulfurtransferase
MAEGSPREIDAAQLRALLDSPNGSAPQMLDIREPWEIEICAFEGSINIPMGFVPQHVSRLPRDGMIVVVCHHGRRSAHVTEWLRGNGFDNAVNLAGGIDEWARLCDSNMKTY